MVYALVGLAVAFLGTTIWLGVWIARLKDDVQDALAASDRWRRKAIDLETECNTRYSESQQLRLQLDNLNRSYKEVLDALESGDSSVSDIAARLRNGLPKVP